MTTNITTASALNIIREIEEAFFDIPFENSDFQNEAFVIGGQITPERAYRAIGLRMHAKLRALSEADFGRQLADIDIEELQSKNLDPSTSLFDRRRNEIEIQKILSTRNWTEKLTNDLLRELSALYKHFRALPKFTRKQFEAGEFKHFDQRLQRQANGVTGAIESLTNMKLDLQAITMFENEFTALSLDEKNTVDLLKLSNKSQALAMSKE